MADLMSVVSCKSDQCRGTSKWLRKTKLCTNFMQGSCARGASCSFAHAESELQSAPDLIKTKLCKKYEEGECQDPDCQFAHGLEELRLPPNFKRKLCKWYKQGKCRNGDGCEFAHGWDELRAAEVVEEKTVQNQVVKIDELLQKKMPQDICDIPAPPGLSQPLALTSLVQAPAAIGQAKASPKKAEETAELKRQVQQMSMQIGMMSQQMDGLIAQMHVNQLRQDLEKLTAQCAVLESSVNYPSMPEVEAYPQVDRRTSLRTPLKKTAQVFVPNYGTQWSDCDWTNGVKHWEKDWASDEYCDDSTSVGSSGAD